MPSFQYDIAISYASEDESVAKQTYEFLLNYNLKVFFALSCQDEFAAMKMKARFHKLYMSECVFVAAFISKDYIRKEYTMLEARTAMIRHEVEGRNCIIPIYLDGSKLPGLDPDMHYIDVGRMNEKTKEVDIAKDIYCIVNKYKNDMMGQTDSNTDRNPHKENEQKNIFHIGMQKNGSGNITNNNGTNIIHYNK